MVYGRRRCGEVCVYWGTRYEGSKALGDNAIVDVRWRAWRAWRASSTQSPIIAESQSQPAVQGSAGEPPSRLSPKRVRVQDRADLRLGGSQMRWMHVEKPGNSYSSKKKDSFSAACGIDTAVRTCPSSCPRPPAPRLHACCNPLVSSPFPGRSLNRTLRTSLPLVSTEHQTPPRSRTRLTRLSRLLHPLNRVGIGV